MESNSLTIEGVIEVERTGGGYVMGIGKLVVAMPRSSSIVMDSVRTGDCAKIDINDWSEKGRAHIKFYREGKLFNQIGIGKSGTRLILQ